LRALLSEAISLFALLHFNPLTGEAWEQIKHQLGRIRQEKRSGIWKRTRTSLRNNVVRIA
jgi:hypothetical protein